MPLPQPCPDLAALDLLVSVGELGSIRAAALAHGVTQPAASMRLRGLERVLGVVLLDRSPNGARLTPAGTATVAWAATVLDGVRALLAGTAALRAGGGSHLRLAASLTVAEYLVPQWLQRLGAAIPDLQVSLEMGNTAHVTDLVAAGHVDLGFIEGPRPPGRLQSEEVVADELAVLVDPGHPWAEGRRPLTAAQLATTPLLLREAGSGTREVFAEALAAHGLAATAAMELGSTTAIKAAAIAGTAPAVLSLLTVRAELQAGQLVAVACPELPLRREIRAVWNGNRPLSAAATTLLAIASTSMP
ncbi:MAG TPA: LysR family transcriptional regulator [Acidimicrobiales bacterium]|nr:LysR family transcriptional regulator [Acidimicrobiales bacterium]